MTTEPPGNLSAEERNRLALHHLKTHFGINADSFSPEELISINNLLNEYLNTMSPKP